MSEPSAPPQSSSPTPEMRGAGRHQHAPAVRLSRHVAEARGCSRREAELLIEAGHVEVNGRRVDQPGAKVSARDVVQVASNAAPEPVQAVTLLLHKPAGVAAPDAMSAAALALCTPERHLAADRSGIRSVHRHFVHQHCATPLEVAATGLVVFTQDFRIRRKLVEDASMVEHELMVRVRGTVDEPVLRQLHRAPVIDGRAMGPALVSIGSQSEDGRETGLRFAIKGHWPGRIAQTCETAGLAITGMKRIRIGRLRLAGLEPGQWRYLLPYERI